MRIIRFEESRLPDEGIAYYFEKYLKRNGGFVNITAKKLGIDSLEIGEICIFSLYGIARYVAMVEETVSNQKDADFPRYFRIDLKSIVKIDSTKRLSEIKMNPPGWNVVKKNKEKELLRFLFNGKTPLNLLKKPNIKPKGNGNIESEDNDGALGEYEVYLSLLKEFGKKSVKWVSVNAEKYGVLKKGEGNDKNGFDIKYKFQNEWHFVEVKSSTSKSQSFFISINEINAAKIAGNFYHLYIVENVGKKDQEIKNIDNIFTQWIDGDFSENELFSLVPIKYRVVLKSYKV